MDIVGQQSRRLVQADKFSSTDIFWDCFDKSTQVKS